MNRLRHKLNKLFFETKLTRPVFIVGCGRSGTTILGQLLNHHPRLIYLNEPRHLWAFEPRTDVWTDQAKERGGRLFLDADDVIPENAEKIIYAFTEVANRKPKARLVEKLPINSFRIGFINHIFPDALFIHLLRNGLDVARSIGRKAQNEAWYGHKDYKWDLLVDYAESQGLGELARSAEFDLFLRGLLEWRLSVTTAKESLAKLPAEQHIEIRYENLLTQPETTISQLETFIGIPAFPDTHEFAQKTLEERNTNQITLLPRMDVIAGDLLRELGYSS
jgi:hypothetical protein